MKYHSIETSSHPTEKMISFLLLVFGIVASAVAKRTVEIPEYLERGNCAEVGALPKFDLRRYSGRWYQTDVIEIPHQPYTRCINSFYDYSEPMYGFNVRTAGLTPEGTHEKNEGKIYPTDENPASHMLIDFPTVLGYPYVVIDTNYETYACVYSCVDWNEYKTEFAFVFSRTPENNGPATAKCKKVFSKRGIDFSKFVTVPHTEECTYRA
ncbi:crustacyanin-A2 subunit-like [Palaemon carinicauda]|uniref:crustacyanin-A2 subunit-like n=1 Tax=Palaemon carinicauda TaxID=392227 RepID=UPI0035B5E79F